MVDVVARTGLITPAWLTEALASTGKLNSRVKSVSIETVGAGVGLMAEIARLSIEYEGSESLPTTMIAKCAAQTENKAVAQLLDFYNRETNFYNRVAEHCPFRVPESYFGQVNQETYDFVILMEDLGDVAPNDQITGSSEAEAMARVIDIARLHAQYWGKVHEPDCAWMYDFMSDAENQKLRDLVYAPALEPAILKFSDHFNDKSLAVCRAVGEQYVELMRKVSPAYTFLHGDYRQDNFIYRAGDSESVVMDWQISGTGHGIFDVTYFICQSLQPEMRRRLEKSLLEAYVAELRQGGIADYDFATAWNDYRILCLFCLIYPITVCGSLDLANERGRALAECMLDRNLTVIEDLACDEFLD